MTLVPAQLADVDGGVRSRRELRGDTHTYCTYGGPSDHIPVPDASCTDGARDGTGLGMGFAVQDFYGSDGDKRFGITWNMHSSELCNTAHAFAVALYC
jgi:hypothetical protein